MPIRATRRIPAQRRPQTKPRHCWPLSTELTDDGRSAEATSSDPDSSTSTSAAAPDDSSWSTALTACQAALTTVQGAQSDVAAAQTSQQQLEATLDAAVGALTNAQLSGSAGAASGSPIPVLPPPAAPAAGTAGSHRRPVRAARGTGSSGMALPARVLPARFGSSGTATGTGTAPAARHRLRHGRARSTGAGAGTPLDAATATVATAEDLSADQAAIDLAQLNVQIATQNLAAATLTSPLSGTVAAVSITPGPPSRLRRPLR